MFVLILTIVVAYSDRVIRGARSGHNADFGVSNNGVFRYVAVEELLTKSLLESVTKRFDLVPTFESGQ